MRSSLLLTLLFLFLTSACDSQRSQPDFIHQIEGSDFALMFSHNINGETHPCGCHKFPRGGIAELYGLFHQRKSERPQFYVDVGDTFFPSPVLPENRLDSLSFTAQTIANGLDQLELRYLVPGEHDFALGPEYLRQLLEGRSFKLLLSNLKTPDFLPHHEWALIDTPKAKIYLLGLLDPLLLKPRVAAYFADPDEALKAKLELLEREHGLDLKNPEHYLVVLSHAGMDKDRGLAERFPQIDWIIGSHSQSFTQVPEQIGDTTLVQVLSRNHFAGEIRFQNEAPQFVMHEVKDDLDEVVENNPVSALIEQHLKDLAAIQAQEQARLEAQVVVSDRPLATANSCLECHADQGLKWMQTPHAIAYHTLVLAGEPNNMSCIGCHSVGANDPNGFQTAKTMVIFDEEKKDASHEQYWKDFKTAFADVGRVQDLSGEKIQQLSQRWQELDRHHQVNHQFANVQCLNCHQQHPDHPFHIGDKKGPDARRTEITQSCLGCHTRDQSPGWYLKDEKGLAGELDQEVFDRAYKKIACPSLAEES